MQRTQADQRVLPKIQKPLEIPTSIFLHRYVAHPQRMSSYRQKKSSLFRYMYSLLLKLFCSESLNLSDVSPATRLEKKKSNHSYSHCQIYPLCSYYTLNTYFRRTHERGKKETAFTLQKNCFFLHVRCANHCCVLVLKMSCLYRLHAIHSWLQLVCVLKCQSSQLQFLTHTQLRLSH